MNRITLSLVSLSAVLLAACAREPAPPPEPVGAHYHLLAV